MSLSRDYISEVKRLLALTAELVESLGRNAVLARYVPDLHQRRAIVEKAFLSGASPEELRSAAHELKTTLNQISAHHTKGEADMENPGQLAEALELVFVFQEARHAAQ